MSNELNEFINDMKQRMAAVRSPVQKKDYQCAKCRDTGWLEYQDNGYTKLKRCGCWEIQESRRLLEQSGISAEFQSKGFKNFETRNIPQLINAKNKAIEYFQNFEKCETTKYNSILLCGQVGAGKTHLGIAICSNLMSRRVPVIYMAYRNTVTKIKQKITDEREYKKELEKYMQARVLYIDDLLKGKITESDVNILYEIVNYRYMNKLPLIISTEKSVSALLDFDEAIASRMLEMCRGNIVKLQGEELNYRLNYRREEAGNAAIRNNSGN